MVGPWIHQVGHADLLDAPKSLEIRVLDNVEMKLVGDADKAIDRVVEDFLFVGLGNHLPLFFGCKGSAFWAVGNFFFFVKQNHDICVLFP